MGGWGIEEAEGVGRQKGHGTAGRRSGTEERRDSRESAYPEGRRKTVKVRCRDVNKYSSQCLQLCFCTGREPQQPQGHFSINL